MVLRILLYFGLIIDCSHRSSWDKLWIVLLGTTMAAYKDQKSYRSAPESHYHGEPPLEIAGGAAEVADDYTKKKHVFRLK